MVANVAAARRGSVQGFPCRHYGRCVLDEHIAGEANAGRPNSRRQSVSKAERNGRGQKSPDGRPRGRVASLDWRPSGRPSSRTTFNGQIGKRGVATKKCAGR